MEKTGWGYYDPNWQLLVTRYGDLATNNFVDLNPALPAGPKGFYRLKLPEHLHP